MSEINKIKKKRKYIEFGIQASFCDHLKLKHKDVLFMSDVIGNGKIHGATATKNERINLSEFKCPDLIIFEPNEKYHGLFFEFKKETPFKKNGGLKKNKHFEAQQRSINDLLDRGYYACFVWSKDMAIEILEKYLDNEL